MTKRRTITLFLGKISKQFALFYEKFTRLTRILHDRRSQRSRQISTLTPGVTARGHDMILSAWVADEGLLQWLSLLGISFINPSTWSIFKRALSKLDDNSDESNQEQKLESISERPAGNVASCKRNAAFKNSSPGIALFKKAAHTSAIASLSMRRQAGISGIERFRWAVKRVMQYKALTGYKLSDSCNRSSSAPVMSGNLPLCDS